MGTRGEGLLTGQAGLEAMVRAVNFAKLDYYIGKPWSQDELVAVVRNLLGEYIREYAPDPDAYRAFLEGQ